MSTDALQSIAIVALIVSSIVNSIAIILNARTLSESIVNLAHLITGRNTREP